MTLIDILEYVDRVKPNDFEVQDKMQWLNEIEGMVQAEVLLRKPEDTVPYIYGVVYTGSLNFVDDHTLNLSHELMTNPRGDIVIKCTDASANNGIYDEWETEDGLTFTFPDGTFTVTGSYSGEAKYTEVYLTPIVPYPYDEIYYLYMIARADFDNGEYDKYDNTMQMFNNKYAAFRKWFTTHYCKQDGTLKDDWNEVRG